MKLILCRNKHLGSILLRMLMWSKYSHSAMFDEDDGVVYDSTMWGGGFQVTPWQEWVAKYPTLEVRDTSIVDAEGARTWLKEQVGKPYDWSALIGMALHRNWQDDRRWFCSEGTETAISLFGVPRFRAEMGRITPRHQEMLADYNMGDK